MALRNLFGAIATKDDISKLALLLRAILDKLPFIDTATAGSRVAVQGTVPVSGTIGQVTALSNVTSIGGLLANADQYVQMQVPAAALRNRISVS